MEYHYYLTEEQMARYIKDLEDDELNAVARRDYELANIKRSIKDWNVMLRPEYRVKPKNGHRMVWTHIMTMEAYPEMGLHMASE